MTIDPTTTNEPDFDVLTWTTAYPSTLTFKCDKGFVCKSGSYLPGPIDDIIGYVCPIGKICAEGTTPSTMSNCNAGKYTTFTKSYDNVGFMDCVDCIKGHYCTDSEPVPCDPATFRATVGATA